MFATEESTPWYRSIAGVVGLSILLPPAGLALLWLRRESSTKSKILATLGIVVLAAGYLYAYSAWNRSALNESQYSALEQHRAEQAQAQAPAGDQAALATNPAQPAAAA